MRILIIGGTGTMGQPLTERLSRDKSNTVYIMVRNPREPSTGNVIYLPGNAFDFDFFVRTVSLNFDVIVDFMIWEPNDLKERLDVIFRNCKQYITMGTSSEYADTGEVITEKTPRLFDRYSEEERKQTHRYHIKKSADDDIIINSPYHHWTIVRPWVTFNTRKCVLVSVPVSVWLWRYLHDRTVFLPQAVMDRKCTFTYGGDVALAIEKLVGNQKALGEVVNIASDRSTTWAEVLEMFQELLSELGGKPLKICLLSDASVVWKDIPSQYDPILRDRYYDRCFSMDKLNEICGEKIEFGDLRENLRQCIDQLLHDPNCKAGPPFPDYNGLMDRLAHESTPLDVYAYKKQRMEYLIFRSPTLSRLYRIYRYLKHKEVRFVYARP